MLIFIDIGFLSITIWDVLDIFIVGYLIYRLYILLRGTVAFNIFIGTLALFAVWWLVRMLNMSLLSSILNQFVNVGVILIIIIFQPEVRRFLLLVGNSALKGQTDFFNKLFKLDNKNISSTYKMIHEVKLAAFNMAKSKTGALILFSNHANVEDFANSGVSLNADISAPLLESVFFKDNPLHDGAMIISNNKIKAAGCVLPISADVRLPQGAGLRHRAGVSSTEGTDVIALMISEETGEISLAVNGTIEKINDTFEFKERLKKLLSRSNKTKLTEQKSK